MRTEDLAQLIHASEVVSGVSNGLMSWCQLPEFRKEVYRHQARFLLTWMDAELKTRALASVAWEER